MASHAPITGAPTRAPAIDRRSLFTAGAILATVPVVALSATCASTSAWDRAVAAEKAARRVMERDSSGDAEMDVWLDCHSTALTTPAPHHAALLWKLDELFGDRSGRKEGESGDAWCADYIDAVMSDAHRLLATGRA